MNVPLMGAVEKERRTYFSVANVLTILAMAGALAASYATLSADNADTKRRVLHLEDGEQRTQHMIRSVQADVKETKDSVNLILRKLDSMQAVERERERARTRRDRQ